MGKKYIKRLLIALGVMLGIALQIIVNTYDKDEKILCSVFANSNVISTQGELIVQGEISDKYMTDQDIEEMLKYIAKQVGISGEKCLINNKEGKWHLEGEEERISLVIDTDKFNEIVPALVSIKVENGSKDDAQNKTNNTDDNESLLNIRKKLNEFFENIKVENVENSLILKGCYMGRLSDKFISENAEKMYNQLEGEIKYEEYRDGIFYSYGYTDKIEEYIISENEKININIVYTYDETANQTWIYLGSPIINIDY